MSGRRWWLCRGCGVTTIGIECPLCGGRTLAGIPGPAGAYASSQDFEPASRRARKPYTAPAVAAESPARVGLATLLGAFLAPWRRPPGVPAAAVPPAELAKLRELAALGAPCRAGDCDDPMCALARAVLAL